MFAGCNVENASFGLTICAERNAIFQAVAHGCRDIRALVVVTPTTAPTPPCGACLQVLHEFGPQADVFSFTTDGAMLATTVTALLPRAFGPESIG